MTMIDTWEKVINPNFINAELIGGVGAERVVTIKDIDYRECFEQKSNSKVQKVSLIFEECKPMVLNKTNSKTLMKLFGSTTPADCVNKKITLYAAAVKVAGKQTTGIRIKEYSEILCEECKKPIQPAAGKTVDELIEISKRNCKRILCVSCMKKVKEREDK